jgi:hypothetical protein
MSKISKKVSSMKEANKLRPDEIVTNFMGGDSYKFNPIDTLKMIAASSIFGEPAYYRKDVRDGKFSWEKDFSDEFSKMIFAPMDGKSTTEVFTESIDAALDYNFEATLNLAAELRDTYNMRLNPQVIMVRAAIHPKREEFTSKNPGKFAEIESKVMSRADEPMSQLAYYMFLNNGNKNKVPTILKKSIAKKLSNLSRYEVNKYKNHEIGMINAVRISHANSEVLNELMKNGSVKVDESESTWEQKKSAGASWKEILETTKLGHMALLRNLRNIFTEISDDEICNKVLEDLKAGVLKGKQFPFRYYSAYKMIEEANINHKAKVLDALEECMDIAIDNMPKLKGKTMCLSDNSGSAWGAFNSEYGTTRIAEIDNLSSVLIAKCSEEGTVGKFGDELKKYDIKKRDGVLSQARKINETEGRDVGLSTEGGIWKFFKEAIDKKIFYDRIIIYSDMQCGTGGLYGTSKDESEYSKAGFNVKGNYINVYKLILEYHKKVNAKCNFYCCQTAGYPNVLVPQNSYRCSMLTGWSNNQAEYIYQLEDIWNEVESKKTNIVK